MTACRIPNGSPTADAVVYMALAAIAGADGVRTEEERGGVGRVWVTAEGEEAEVPPAVFDEVHERLAWVEVVEVGSRSFVRPTARGLIWLDRFRKVNKL